MMNDVSFRTLALCFLSACTPEPSGCDVGPIDIPGDIPACHQGSPTASAETVAEAWADRPAPPSPLTRQEIVDACLMAEKCGLDGAVDCIANVEWSAERAIPLSFFGRFDERPEYFVRCVLDKNAECNAVATCLTERTVDYYCEEDGCTGTATQVTCHGSVARSAEGASRDCAKAFAECDPASSTGCTDRNFTSCGASLTSDRCDGSIRLGCDGCSQTSYRDCERMGGECNTAPDGASACVYTSTPAPECQSENVPTCINGKRVFCVASELVSTNEGCTEDSP